MNRVTNELSEVTDNIAMAESFSHCVALSTADGLVCFDASGAQSGQAVSTRCTGGAAPESPAVVDSNSPTTD